VAARRVEAHAPLSQPAPSAPTQRRCAPTASGSLGLTLLSPATVGYFVALILGLQADALSGASTKAMFVLGAFAASASWQLTLVAAGGLLSCTSLITGLVGNAVIVFLALRLLLA